MSDYKRDQLVEIEFVDDLPARYKRSASWRSELLSEFAEQLRANPGRWAKYPLPLKFNSAWATGSRIRGGMVQALPADEFDAAVREGVLYVRAVPGE